MQYLKKWWCLEPNCMDSDPSSAIQQLCHSGQVFKSPCSSISLSGKQDNNSTYLVGLLCTINNIHKTLEMTHNSKRVPYKCLPIIITWCIDQSIKYIFLITGVYSVSFKTSSSQFSWVFLCGFYVSLCFFCFKEVKWDLSFSDSESSLTFKIIIMTIKNGTLL